VRRSQRGKHERFDTGLRGGSISRGAAFRRRPEVARARLRRPRSERTMTLLRGYLRAAFTALTRHKRHSVINLIGLAIGLASFILIASFVRHELGYDRQWANADRIYRVSRNLFGEAQARPAGMPGLAGPLLEEHFDEVEKAARLYCCGHVVENRLGEAQMEWGYADADNALFEIFDFEWLAGDPATALTSPQDVVLTRGTARKYFGDEDPIGQTLRVGTGGTERWSLDVVGVIEDPPPASHLAFDLLGSMLAWQGEGLRSARYLNDWTLNEFHTYVRLREGADAAVIERGSREFLERYVEPAARAGTDFSVIPVGDIYLHSDRDGEMKMRGSRATVYAFAVLATFVLILACINFTNLATAQATQRAREIGVRKANGAGRVQILCQFLVESVVLSALAVLVALMLVELTLPRFGELIDRELSFDYLHDPRTAGGLIVLTLATALLAGGYPALYLARFEPARVLRGDTGRGASAASLRKVLVVFQFSIAITLLIGTAVVHDQLRFARDVKLGYDKERIIVVFPNSSGERWDSLKPELLAHPEITHVTSSFLVPFQHVSDTAEIRALESEGPARRMQFLPVDFDFFETYDMEIVAGRSFSRERGTDRFSGAGNEESTTAYVINESAARQLGWTPEQAVGNWLEMSSLRSVWERWVTTARGPVVGVAGDAHFESLHTPIQPTVYWILGRATDAASLKVTGRDLESTVAFIEAKWREYGPNLPVSLRFLEQDFEALYQSERRQAQVFTFFTVLAIAIAGLGLFGLASFAAERRTKEIGIRKAVGGTMWDVVRLFASEFGKLVLLANVIAWPLAYLAMQRWLAGFAYRVELGAGVFVGAAIMAFAIAWLTVGAVAARAASAKPVRALRYE
jgi:putative ABC transport system permease protein